MRQGRILVVDDDERWQSALASILQRAGYHVDAVSTHGEALKQLKQESYHLAVLDIRLTESDPDNVEGMSLLSEIETTGLAGAMEVIMLSAYATVAQMRTAFRQYRISDFLSKDEFESLEFPKRVDEVFARNLRINLNLEIHWELGELDRLVLALSQGDSRSKRDGALQERFAAELDDLLCRLFNQAESLLVRSLAPWSSGAGVLSVQPFYHAGAGRSVAVAVKFGELEEINTEYQNFLEFVQPYVGGEQSTTGAYMRRTPFLGGIVYLPPLEVQTVKTFGAFYSGADVPQIRSSLDNLIFNTCGAWYANIGRLQLHDLSLDYQEHLDLGPEKLQTLLETLKPAQKEDQLRFDSLGAAFEFASPLRGFTDQPMRRSTYLCVTHGGLDEHNILIADTGQTYLVDFARTGRGHLMRDVAALDALVRLKLLASEEATLEERLRMENALCAAERFSELGQSAKEFLDSTENPSLIKAFSTALHLRGLARQLVANNPSDDISELYIALFYYAVDALRLESLSELQRDHALLSASLLYEALQGVVHRRYLEMEIESLEGRLQDKGRFQLLSIASHQLKTPLGNINVILEDMRAGVYGAVNDRQERRLEQAIASVAREFTMIERMLDLTRVESGRVKPDLSPCNLLDCLRGAVNDNRGTLERKALALKLMLPSDGIRIIGDATLLTAAFSNVLENAVKFTERGEVGVRCESEKDWVSIDIWDTGLGISEDALPHIFDNYFQADAGLARRYEGLGAGLSLAKEWLKLHGGTIEAKSARGEGTTFMIRLPIHQVSVIGV